jgi:sugar O-acyltransferase (sialic acid O-acetyltransferase NeuD family)
MKQPILLVGGGGHALSVVDVIEATNQFAIKGIVDTNVQRLLGYPVLGDDSQLAEFIEKTPNCVISVGQIKSAQTRKHLFKKAKNLGYVLPNIISPFARIASSVKLADSICIMHHAIVSHLVVVGENTIINNQALIEHESNIGKHCHIATGAIINGCVSIGDECFIGSGAVVANNVSMCSNVVIGSGTVVIKDITSAGTYLGNPARKL